MHAVALVAAGAVAAAAATAGRPRGRRAASRSCRSLRGDVRVERLDPDAVGLVALELGGRAGEHERAAAPRARPRSSASSRDLPIPGSPSTARQPPRRQRGVEPRELRAAPDAADPGVGSGCHP